MRIAVYNCRDSYLKDLLKLGTYDYCERLFDKRVMRYLSFNIVLKDHIEEKIEGECEVIDWKSGKDPRKFRITLLKVAPPSLFSSLAHEVVHAWQFAHNYVDGDLKKWRGKRIPASTDYWDEPWEIEAYGREPGLYVRFRNKYNLEEFFKKNSATVEYLPNY